MRFGGEVEWSDVVVECGEMKCGRWRRVKCDEVWWWWWK